MDFVLTSRKSGGGPRIIWHRSGKCRKVLQQIQLLTRIHASWRTAKSFFRGSCGFQKCSPALRGTPTTPTPDTETMSGGTCARFFPGGHVKSPTKTSCEVRILHLTSSKSRAAQFAYCRSICLLLSTSVPNIFLFKKMRLRSFKLNFPEISTYEEQLSKVHLLFYICNR